MGQPAAKQGDHITAIDIHLVMVPSPDGPVPKPLPHPFDGIMDGNLSANVNVMGRPAATVGSSATNTPPHIPTPPGMAFQKPPANRGSVTQGSGTVLINGQPAARNGDQAQTCADPAPNMNARVVAAGTVLIGG